MNLLRLTAIEALKQMQEGTLSSVELTEAYLSQIGSHDSDVSAYLKVIAWQGSQ